MSTVLVSGLPGVTQNLAAMCRVSLHITGEGQGARHKRHTVAKIVVRRIQLELPLLCETWTVKMKVKVRFK